MTTASPKTDNALLSFALDPDATGRLPPFSTITAEQVVPAIDALLLKLDADVAALEKKLSPETKPTYDDVVEASADLVEPVSRAWGAVSHLMGVKNHPALREAQQQAQPKIVMAMMKLAQSEPLFHALQAVASSSSFQTLSPARKRIVEQKLLEAKLSGIALLGLEKERFNAIEQELSELSTTFSNHVLDATKAWSLTLTSKDDVDGLPDSWKTMSAVSMEPGKPGDPNNGPWKVTLDFPSFGPFMKYASRRDLRERVYKAYLARASDLDTAPGTEAAKSNDNRPLIARILELRAEKAKLLGYGSYAEVSLATKMAGSTAAVHKLLDELRAVSLDVARAELAELETLAGTKLVHWDIEYWAEKLREQRYAYSEEELRKYFEFDVVLQGLWQLVKRLFGVDVIEDTQAVERWHDDVRFYRVTRDVDGVRQPVAAFFLDPFARPADKRPGAWMDDCVTRRLLPDGSTRLPVAYLVCNMPAPQKTGQATTGKTLMPFRDVETLFHEFGHGLQQMMSTVADVDASGIRGVEWDAVELPSQFMENWCTDEATLMGFAKHVDTGAPLPKELFEKLKAQKTYRQASMTMRQILFAAVDLELHEKPLAKGETAFDVQRRLAAKNSVLPVLDEDRFLCSFSHIFAGGYAAGYYSYKWAEVLSADAFAAFEEAGVDNDAQIRAVGAKFRDTVLSLGGSVHPLEVFQQFRGRAPSTEALLRHAGLKRSA